MATKKTKAAKKQAPAKKASAKTPQTESPGGQSAAPASSGPSVESNESRRVLLQLQARHGHVDDDHRAAYDQLITDAGRAVLGTKTRAEGVLREGVAWAVQIDRAFSQYPAVVAEHYARPRFAYLLDRLSALAELIDAQHTQRSGTGVARGTAEDRERAARTARRVLISKMKGYAGRREAEGNELASATGTTDGVTKLAKSIRDLVALAGSWLARTEVTSAIQCKSAGLTEALVARAVAAADALVEAATDATLAGRRSSADAPEVNLVEGTVLHEMEEAQRCFEDAHEASRLVPRLTAGPATRHVLGRRSAPPREETAPSPAPAAPPA